MVKRKNSLSPDTLIKDSGLSMRAINTLFQHSGDFGIDYIPGISRKTVKLGDFQGLSLHKIRGYRGVGKKTMLEIAEVLEQAGVRIEEDGGLEEYKGEVSIHFDKNSRNGKVLFSLAKLLAEQDRNIIITDTD